MDKTKANLIAKEAEDALRAVARKHGLSLSPGRGNFDSVGLKMSFIFGDTADVGSTEINPEYIRNLIRNGFMYGLDKSLVGKTITIGSKSGLEFQGLKGKKAAFKWEADNRIWLYDAVLAAQLLKVAK